MKKSMANRIAEINRGILSANIGLTLSANSTQILEEKAIALTDINRILKHAEALRDCLVKIDIDKSSFHTHGLEKFVHSYIYSNEPDPDLTNYVPDAEDAEGKEEINQIFKPIADSLGLSSPPSTNHGYVARSYKWDDFFENLVKQIEIYKSIQFRIKNTKRSGRPNTLKGLTEFVYQIALLYQDTTGRSFTVDEHRVNGEPVAVTEGMIFAWKALESVYMASHSLFGRPESFLALFPSVPARQSCLWMLLISP